ncbi:MAG: hypothetical protein WEA09_12495 [Gemmatimonadota bacterium]
MSQARPERTMIGIYDFSYGPYALGDALTWTMNVNIRAAETGADAVDQYLVMNPRRPASHYQPFIHSHNYVTVMDNLFPAFLCSPRLRSLKLIRNPHTFNLFLTREALRRRPMWPGLLSHLNGQLDFISHRRIDRYYGRQGTLPWLGAPRGYGAWADAFLRDRCAGRFVVTINVRQGELGLLPANLHRDSPLPVWEVFMAEVAQRHPDTLFLVLGGYTEWYRSLLRLPNVIVPRALGFGLGHELALVHRAHLFMGTSSGFATMATFCGVPYVITKIEHLFAKYAGVEVGARHYNFAHENQILYWETETREVLLDFFEEVRGRLGKDNPW